LSLKKRKNKIKKSLPIIYLHDFLIEKTKNNILKKERKRSLPIIYLHDFFGLKKPKIIFLKEREKDHCQ
jgi:hypothetical protein